MQILYHFCPVRPTKTKCDNNNNESVPEEKKHECTLYSFFIEHTRTDLTTNCIFHNNKDYRNGKDDKSSIPRKQIVAETCS